MQPSSKRSSRPLWIMFAGVVMIALGVMIMSWDASLLDRYEFRQLQTALSTYWIAQEGWQLNYPLPLFGPPWSVPMEFPTYQIIVAQLHHLLSMPLEQTGRLVGIFFLLLTLPAFFDLLAVSGLTRSRRLIVLAVALSSPMYLFYARTFMIETTALCFCVWFLALFRRSLSTHHIGLIAFTAIVAILAALTKITTFLVFGIPAVALAIDSWRTTRSERGSEARTLRPMLLSCLLAALSLGITWCWVGYSDAIKDSNPFTGFLTSRELHHWNYGTWGLRFDWSFWVKMQENITGYVLAEGALAVGLLCVPFAPRRTRQIAAIAVAGFLFGPLVFANLYHAHDYYYSANALLLVGAVGLLLATIWDDPRLPRGANWLALSLILIFQGYAFYRGYYSHHRNPAQAPPALANVIQNTVPPDGVVLIYGADWNPLLPYYFQRRAVMVPGEREHETDVLETVIAKLAPLHVSGMIIHGPSLEQQTDFIAERTSHFGLASQPYARSGSDILYLPATVAPIAHGNDSTVQLLRLPASDTFAEKLKNDDRSALDLSLFTPQPDLIRSQYGVTSSHVNGELILNAHAPSELVFAVPPGARYVEATVGLPDGAFAPDAKAITDGISIDIIARPTTGSQQRLYQRHLDPANRSDDRGPQHIKLELPISFSGQVLFRLGNGPQHDPTNDWAYWSSISIH